MRIKIKKLGLICSLICTVFLSACSSIHSPFVIGQAVEFSDDEIGNETVWKIDDEIYHVRVVGSNAVAVGEVKWDQTNRTHTVETTEIILSELDGYRFLNVKEDNSFLICYMAVSGERNVVFYPVNENIKKHLSSGNIERVEKEGAYLLKGSKKEIDEFVRSNLNSLFDTNSPLVAELVCGEIK